MNTVQTTIAGYTTSGPIRGQCGHLHPTEESAQRCLERDQGGCNSQRGYSDRRVVEVGSDGYLYHDVSTDDWVPSDGGRSCGAMRMQGR